MHGQRLALQPELKSGKERNKKFYSYREPECKYFAECYTIFNFLKIFILCVFKMFYRLHKKTMKYSLNEVNATWLKTEVYSYHVIRTCIFTVRPRNCEIIGRILDSSFYFSLMNIKHNNGTACTDHFTFYVRLLKVKPFVLYNTLTLTQIHLNIALMSSFWFSL